MRLLDIHDSLTLFYKRLAFWGSTKRSPTLFGSYFSPFSRKIGLRKLRHIYRAPRSCSWNILACDQGLRSLGWTWLVSKLTIVIIVIVMPECSSYVVAGLYSLISLSLGLKDLLLRPKADVFSLVRNSDNNCWIVAEFYVGCFVSSSADFESSSSSTLSFALMFFAWQRYAKTDIHS